MFKLAFRTISFSCSLVLFDHHIIEYLPNQGDSMVPALFNNDRVLVDRVSYSYFGKKFKHNDIVTILRPLDPEILICKRIVAMEGETVYNEFKDSIIIPRNHVWVMGDNLHASSDSREFGPVPLGLLQGRVMLTFFPEQHLIR